MMVGLTHVQPEQFEASQPLRQPRGEHPLARLTRSKALSPATVDDPTGSGLL